MAHIIFLHGASSSGKSTIAKTLQERIEQWSDSRTAFFDGFHASLKAYADAGNNLILEHILDTAGWLENLSELLAGHDVLFVAVHCPLDLLIERETLRGDRPMGSAMQDYETIHIGKVYDLELQSTDGADANADKLLRVWRSGRRVSSFSGSVTR